ncbi:cellulose biosynthesis protein BcsF [Shimwellia blattae]|uniref:cellulose biosynthesis protein BcsF n=1 Tax=Shimwellia blattae TaxID=563 RepID=UPI000291C1DC|nr:cellulose biosynthesis protein BcsF [Shimwellia blattae]GAB80608.1 hypothetical protein YhjT [Shimwellia blattae DSM 4481 = NBRC 105725]VDY62758.1 celllulose biosynthesis operon protein BcsF/YhjT [Shimwellia blattae]VEC19578.1 celllulose biosynthesis operon protein BcsF/YhjT [Shimwellia blattae]
MNINDILQLIFLCAVIFIPLGYALHPRLPGIIARVTRTFFTARYLKPAGVIRRSAAPGATRKHD